MTSSTSRFVRSHVVRSVTLAALLLIALGVSARAATQTWTGAIDNVWRAANNWNTGVPGPTDIGLFDGSSIANLTITLDTGTTVGGLAITSPAGPVSIGTSALTVGTGGIDMSTATQNLSITSGLTLGGGQTWTIASGRSVTEAGAFTRSAGATLNVTGAGSATLGGATANALLTQATTLAPYATFNGTDFAGVNGSGAVVSGSTVLAYFTPAGTGNITISSTNVPINVANGTGVRLGNSITVSYGLLFNTNRGGNWTIDTASAGRLLTTGGLMVTNNVGAFDVTIGGAGGGVRPGGNVAGGEFLIHQYNTAGSLIFNTGGAINNNNSSTNVTKTGPGKAVFNTSMGFTGTLRINQGTVQIGNASASGTLNAATTVSTSGTLAFSRTDAVTFTNAVSGTGVVAQAGNGLVTMSNVANSYSGGTQIGSGTLSYANGLADLGTGGLTFTGGVFQWKAGDTTDISSRTVTFASGVGGLNANGGSVTLANPIGNGGSGGLRTVGTGTINLTAANTFSGTSSLDGGVLTVNNATGSALGTGAATVNSGARLSGTGAVSGLVTVASGGVLAPGNSVGALTLGSLTLSGGSSLIWEFSSTPANDLVVVSDSGGLSINGGAITLYDESTTTAFATDGTYNLFQYTGSIGGTGVGALTVANQQAGKAYTFGTSGGFVTLSIATSGLVASWSVDASGNWTTGGNWSPSEPNAAGDTASFGAAITAPRTVTLDANRSIGNITFNNANAYTIAPAAAEVLTVGDGTADKTLQVISGSHTIAAGLVLSATTITADIVAGQSLTLSGPISGSATLTKGVSAGTLVLTGSNSYTGGTNINLGTVEFAANALGGTVVSIDGGTLRYAAGNTEDVSTKTVTVGIGGATIDTNGNDVTLANAIGNAGTGGLTKAGAGTLTLGGSNSYTGSTTITGGTLAITANSNLGDLGANAGVVLAGGALRPDAALTTSRNMTVTAASVLDVANPTTLNGTITHRQQLVVLGWHRAGRRHGDAGRRPG